MPIVRSYMCAECGHHMEVTLSLDQADDPPPECERCLAATQQDFKPVAIRNHAARTRDKANKLTEDIIEKDYHVGNIHRDRHEGSTPKVTYADQGRPANPSTWGAAQAAIEGAIRAGRQSRQRYGSGLDILHKNLKSGAEPDLIEISKRRAMRVY